MRHMRALRAVALGVVADDPQFVADAEGQRAGGQFAKWLLATRSKAAALPSTSERGPG